MADLRIVDAPLLSTVKGTEKIPTGGEGNFSISVNQVADFAKLKWFLATEEYVDNAVGNVQDDLNLHKNNSSNPHGVTKVQVGLGNVDNTADVDKPIGSATQAALSTLTQTKADKTYVDAQLNNKADKSTTYTKTETESLVSAKSDTTYVNTKYSSHIKTFLNTGTALSNTVNGEYFFVISNDSEKVEDLYLNVNGVATNQNKSELSSLLQHNSILGRDVTGAHQATSISTASGVNQQQINDFGGAKWYAKVGGYELGATVKLANGGNVKSTVAANTNDPNVDMTGWAKIGDQYSATSISEILLFRSMKTGDSASALSFDTPILVEITPYRGGGRFVFIKDDTNEPNDVNIFEGIGGNWHRLNWENPSIYDAGITGNEEDNTTKFQKLVDAASENLLRVDLKKKIVKIKELDIPSNMYIQNGTLDTKSTTWADVYGRGAYMFKSTPRDAMDGASYLDYSTDIHYLPLDTTENIVFENVHFDAVSTSGMFIKFKNMAFINCSGKWNNKTLFWMIGGLHGTPVITDSPSSYNLIDPINGWNEHIRIKDCDWDAGYNRSDFSSPFRFNACRDVVIEGGSNNAPLGWFVDTYCSKVVINQADVIVTDPNVVLDRINGTSKPEMLALYVGQNSYDVEVNGGLWQDYGDMGLYMEGSSQVRLNGVRSRHTNPNNIAVNAILQPNWRTNTGEFGAMANVADVYLNDIDFKGAREGIITQAFNITQQSLKDIHVSGSVEVSTTLAALAITGTTDYTIHDFKAKGALSIGRNNGDGEIKSSGFRNTANYALYVDEMLDGLFPKISNTDFIVGSGPVIYNNGGATRDGKIVGGRVYAEDFVGDVILNGPNASNLSVVDFEYNGDRHIIYPYSLTVDAGAKKSFYISDTRYKSGWSCTANVLNADSVGDLAVRANVLNGSIYVTIENKTASNITALPINLAIQLFTFASKAYEN